MILFSYPFIELRGMKQKKIIIDFARKFEIRMFEWPDVTVSVDL